MKSDRNGLILHETSDLVVIATGLRDNSTNSKTGSMIQTYILTRHISPIEAVKTGQDSIICLDCPLRGNAGENDRLCYVRYEQAALGVWKAYRRGAYAYWNGDSSVFVGRDVRFGAYGEPVLIPRRIVADIAGMADSHTGYTHQWRKAEYQWAAQYFMASCESRIDSAQARLAGWRTFRVSPDVDPMAGLEISCPASREGGQRTTCENCGLCCGTAWRVKSITLQLHGAIAVRRLPVLVQLSMR